MKFTNQKWLDPSRHITHIHVAEDVLSLEYTQKILARAGLPVRVVPRNQTPLGLNDDYCRAITQGKQHLFLCNNRGSFFKPCPGTAEYNCCGYQVLNIGMNCPIDCSYCILQAYLNQPWITAFVNLEQLFDELRNTIEQQPQHFFRIGTGEFTDSLALERLTGISEMLVEFLGRYDNVILELKTKSGAIDTLETIDHKGKTILSWSLNSPAMMRRQEIRSATLKQRLDCAARAAEWGYHLAFHFDPIIYQPDWQDQYLQTIELLFNSVPKEAIVWISMGGLRFLQPLKAIGTQRFPQTGIFYEEFITGLDGKSRYFRGLRQEMYSFIYAQLKQRTHKDTCVYFCMESEEIWDAVCGYTPDTQGGLSEMLDTAGRTAIAKY